MGFKLHDLLEPEETMGQLWHALVSKGTGVPSFPEAAVELLPLQKRLQVFFRGLGGDHGVELKPVTAQSSEHRLGWRDRLANVEGEIHQARFDGEHLFLPARLDDFPDKSLNESLYFWLTAFCVSAGEQRPPDHRDPLQRDLERLRFSRTITRQTLTAFPGLATPHALLQQAVLYLRPVHPLPPVEQAIENTIRQQLGQQEAIEEEKETAAFRARIGDFLDNPDQSVGEFKAPPGYHPMRPVVLWGEIQRTSERQKSDRAPDEDELTGGSEEENATDKTIRAKRDKADQVERKDSLILYPFSGFLGWMDSLNINRKVEDEDEDAARRTLDEIEDISLVNVSKRTATRLKFDLDLAPEDVEHERLAGKFTTPEWDYRTSSYLPDHCSILARTAPEAPPGREWKPDEASHRRIRAVRRRFEALHPSRQMLHGQLDGSEFDMDALIRSRCDLAASGEGSDHIFLQSRPRSRDLAISVLIDTSRSTESWIEGRQVIEVAREALAALSMGLKASGDDFALYSFSSLRRERIYVSTIKGFGERVSATTLSRIGALRPGFYTRMGAAIRHVGAQLANQPNERRLLLVLTDGKPNDLDHYEGRYGIEDTRMAILETRRAGQAVFGVTIDAKAQTYFPYIFGRGAYAIVSHPDRLTTALPQLFHHLVA